MRKIIPLIQVVFGYLFSSALLSLLLWFIPVFRHFLPCLILTIVFFKVTPYQSSKNPFAFILKLRFLQR